MRKTVVSGERELDRAPADERWMNLTEIATVEVSSEDPNFPVESIFDVGGPGWRASQKGKQRIRLIFDQPTSVHRIQLRFVEPERERTQEFSLRWSSSEGGESKEIVRQQWNFSPAGSTTELEDYPVTLTGVSQIELVITPDLSHSDTPASLASWRIA